MTQNRLCASVLPSRPSVPSRTRPIPSPYRVDIASVGNRDMDSTLKATVDLQSLRGTAPVSPFGLISRARSDVDRLTTALESFGYYQCGVAIKIEGMLVSNPGLGDALSALPKGKDAQVAISFSLGPLYHLRRIDIDGELPRGSAKHAGSDRGESLPSPPRCWRGEHAC